MWGARGAANTAPTPRQETNPVYAPPSFYQPTLPPASYAPHAALHAAALALVDSYSYTCDSPLVRRRIARGPLNRSQCSGIRYGKM